MATDDSSTLVMSYKAQTLAHKKLHLKATAADAFLKQLKFVKKDFTLGASILKIRNYTKSIFRPQMSSTDIQESCLAIEVLVTLLSHD